LRVPTRRYSLLLDMIAKGPSRTKLTTATSAPEIDLACVAVLAVDRAH
jgi:hypothetical protein